jgi:hypothetical protein
MAGLVPAIPLRISVPTEVGLARLPLLVFREDKPGDDNPEVNI